MKKEDQFRPTRPPSSMRETTAARRQHTYLNRNVPRKIEERPCSRANRHNRGAFVDKCGCRMSEWDTNGMMSVSAEDEETG